MDKFNRKYKLEVQRRDQDMLTIELPFTVEFDIHRNSFSSANTCSIRIYNLAPENRNQIRHDPQDVGFFQTVSLSAGYGDHLSLAFKGNIQQAWSVREGSNMITQIECFDSGFAYVNAVYSGSPFPAGATDKTIMEALIDSLPDVSLGAVGPSFNGSLSRGMAVSGSPIKALIERSGDNFFIDNGVAYCLSPREAIDGYIPLINAQSGLLGTPLLEQTLIHIEMLFEPGLRVSQLVELQSETAELFNGLHKVIALKHRGTISEAVSGSATTTITLLPGTFTTVLPAGL